MEQTCIEVLRKAARFGVMECQCCPAYPVCPTGTAGWNNECMFDTAADLIESLAAELEQVTQERDGLNILLGQAQSMLETRTRERDAAVKDLAIHKFCHLCAEDPIAEEASKCPSCVNKCYWQWRGVKEAAKQ